MKKAMPMACVLLSTGALASSASPSQTHGPTPAQLHQAIHSVISEPVFNHSSENGVLAGNAMAKAGQAAANVLRKIWHYLKAAFKFLRNLFRHTTHTGMQGGLTSNIIVALMITALVLTGGFFIYKLVMMWMGSRLGETAPALEILFEDNDTQLVIDPDTWFVKAEKLANEGRFREAYRAMFIALLMRLHLSQIIELQRGKTNGAYIREVENKLNTDDIRQFRLLTKRYEAAWYGRRLVTADDYYRDRTTVTQLIHSCCQLELVIQ